MRTADQLAHGRSNNFNLIRMTAASAVIVSHSFALSNGPGTWEPWPDVPLGLGAIAVHGFFGLSGFFILKSFNNRRTNLDFILSRAGRILPALAIIYLFMLSLPYLGLTFAGNPYPNEVNGSLWTLKYEVWCYNALMIFGLLGLLRQNQFWKFLVAYAVFYALIKTEVLPFATYFADFSFPFVLGMMAFNYGSHVRLHWTIAALLVVLAGAILVMVLWSLAIVYVSLYLGGIATPLLAYNRLGDYSYGTYIIAWPVQQLLALGIAGIGPYTMMAMALPLTWFFAILSWHLIERPALGFVHSVSSGRFRFRSFDRATA